jgi:phospho-N-acetylmuramoyl-pentapeptide-transferase
MFYLLKPYLVQLFSGFNVLQYITFRSAYAAITALFISLILGPYFIRILRAKLITQTIRDDGPQTHLKKAGTPTMGGLIILAGIMVPVLLWADLSNIFIQVTGVSLLWMGLVGFLDDYLKQVKKNSKGLIARYKLAGQIILGLGVGLAVLFLVEYSGDSPTAIAIPFIKNYALNLGLLFVPFVMFVITAFSNAVNLTDGLDGLAIGLLGICFLVFAGFAYVSGNVKLADYLNIEYIAGAGELAVFCSAAVGASLGFLWYNANPAQIFMGDVGSLALGSALGTLSVLLKREVILVIVGGVFVVETLSVVLQVGSYKLRNKKRIFRMAPIHHHFELLGWPENQVVVRFWLLGILLAIISLSTIKIQ